MRFTKRQLSVLGVLGFTAVIMIIGVIAMPKTVPAPPAQGETQNPDPAPPSETVVHDKFRDPRIAFDEDIFWETNLGGSGNEQVENAYALGKSVLVFGNTESTDYDFDGEKVGMFCVSITENGKPTAYRTYDGLLKKSALCESGILCLAESGGKTLMRLVDASGNVSAEKELALSDNETAADFVFGTDGNEVTVITAVASASEPGRRIRALSLDLRTLSPTDGVVLPSVFNLEYVAALPRGDGYAIAVNATGARTSNLVIYEWKASGKELVVAHDLPIANRLYKAHDFVPYADGYAALIVDENGVADILSVDYAMKNPAIKLLQTDKAQGGRLYSDNRKNYAFVFTGDGIKAYETPLDMSAKTEIASFGQCTELNAFRMTATDTYFGCKNARSPVISILNNQGVLFEKEFGSSADTIKTLIPYNGFILAVCESTAVSLDVGKNFGGSDILIVKLRF